MPLARRTAAVLTSLLLMSGLAAPVSAQGGPPLVSMPPPPSAGDPAPREGTKKAQPRKNRAAKTADDRYDFSEPTTAPARSRGTASGSYQRPQKYVPEEFDRSGEGGGGSGGRMEPSISSSGRPGMGMRF